MGTTFFISAPIYPNIYEMEETKVATAIAAAGTTLVVDNTQGLSVNDYIIIGTLGTETCEIVSITSVDSDVQLTIGAVKFAHLVDESVRRTPFNQIKFYRSSTATGTYTADGTANMQVDNKDLITGYETTTADARIKYWKITYYNATTADETSESDSDAIYGATTLYCNSQDVYNWLNMDDTDLNPNTVTLMIDSATTEIEERTNTVFYSDTVTDEYHDGKGSYDTDYHTIYGPVVSVSSLSTTQDDEDTVAASVTWDSLTENDHYFMNKRTGRIAISNSTYYPVEGKNRLKITYIYGTSSVPSDIRKACILIVIRDLIHSNIGKNMVLGRTNFRTDEQYNSIDTSIDRVLNKHTRKPMFNT